MIEIPIQLQNKKYKFIKIIRDTKNPSDENWNKSNNFQYDSLKFKEYLDNSNIYGVCLGKDLIVIDADSEELINYIENKILLFNTFTVETCSGGKHFYYKVNRDTYLTNLDGEKHYGEIRGLNSNNTYTQVIGPNSKHIYSNKTKKYGDYKVITNVPIADISSDDLEEIKKKFITKKSEIIANNEVDVDNFDEVMSYLLIRTFKNVHTYSTIEKNQGIYYAKKGYDLEKLEKEVKPVYEKNDWNFKNLLGWFEAAKAGKYNLVNAAELINFANAYDKNMLGLIPYPYKKLELWLQSNTKRKLLSRQSVFFEELLKVTNELEQESLLKEFSKKVNVSYLSLKNKFEQSKPKIDKKIITYEEAISADYEEESYYIEDLFPKGKIIGLIGEAGHSKTIIALAMCREIAKGNSFLGKAILQRGNILFQDLDVNGAEGGQRLKAIEKGSSHTGNYGKLDIVQAFNKHNLQSEVELCKPYDIIVIDCLRRVLIGDENKSEVINQFFEDYTKKLKELGKTVLILHHKKKPSKDAFGSIDNTARGSGDFIAQCDVICSVEKIEEKNNEAKTIHETIIKFEFGKRRSISFAQNFTLSCIYDKLQKATFFRFIEEIADSKTTVSPGERVFEAIKDYLKTGVKDRRDIVNFVAKKCKVSEISIAKKLRDLVKYEIISQPSYGAYSLITETAEKETACFGQKQLAS